MSLAGLLDPLQKPWCNVNVNNLNMPLATDLLTGNISIEGASILKCPKTSTIYVGQNAGNYALANNNTAVGNNALNSVSGGQNTALGMEAGLNITTGNNNVVIGYSSGQSLAGTESNNILVGSFGTNGTSNSIEIGTLGIHTTGKIAGAINFGNVANNTEGIKLNNNTASYTPTLLNYYEKAVVSTNFTGSNSFTVNLTYTRIGDTVFVKIPAYTGASNSTGVISGLGIVPTRFRPSGITVPTISVIKNNNRQNGASVVYTNGDLYIYPEPSLVDTFTIGQNNGFSDLNLSWVLN